MRPLLVAGVLLTAVTLGGCGGDAHPTVSSVPSVGSPPASPDRSSSVVSPPGLSSSAASPRVPSRTSPPVVADDPPGSIACDRLATAVTAGNLMTVGVADEIVRASRTADAPLADAADRLEAAYRAAVAAAGKADEPDKVAAVSAAASDMSGVCAESGLRTAG
jgi:hypothetical protein